jgi:hypothetical protein
MARLNSSDKLFYKGITLTYFNPNKSLFGKENGIE